MANTDAGIRWKCIMGCGCGKNKRRNVRDPQDVMGGYKYLKPNQIKARLEVFKKKYCSGCDKRYACDYTMYMTCKGGKK